MQSVRNKVLISNSALFPLKNDTKNISFKGFDVGKISHRLSLEKISNCHLDGIYDNLSKNVASDFIKINGSDIFYKKATAFMDTLKYPFVEMPKQFLNFIANKFNVKQLQESKLLTEFNSKKQAEMYERAMRGFLKNGDNFLINAAKKVGKNPEDIEKFICDNACNPEFKEICNEVTGEFYKLFDSNLAKDKAHYHTPHERTIARIASGVTAAIMMGTDFYNKSILNGKTPKEARQSEQAKRKQELLEVGQEALSQYFMLGAFSSFANNSSIGAPILNTLLSLIFRITSRVSTGRPLKRIYVADKPNDIKRKFSFDAFRESAKNKTEIKTSEIEIVKQEKNKKHLLSAKNIALACFASIGIGFRIKGIKSTKSFEKLKNQIMDTQSAKTLLQKYKNATVGEVLVDEQELNKLFDALHNCGFTKQAEYYDDKFIKIFTDSKTPNNGGKISLGEYEKMTRIPFTKIEMSTKELLQIPLAPFKLIIEFASYPYKAVNKILEASGIVKKSEKLELKNDYNILNTYIDFKERLDKNNGTIDDDFIEKYKTHLEKNRLSALNCETKSNVSNSGIAKTTQLMGTFASIYFAMTDDFNETAKQTGDKEKAQKDARLRGVNKLIRMSTQLICLKLNDIFKIPYVRSILGAGIITTACTILTDSISRTLSGMPFRKMSKEELEQYNKNKKEGILKGYYNALDKLTD